MFRFSLIVCVALIFGVTAKPYKPWNKLGDEAFVDTVMSMDEKGKMSWGVEVEPPKDMDATYYDIDPRMRIQSKEAKAEEDLDELYHPSVADLLKVQIQNLGARPDVDIQGEASQENANTHYLEPEEDRDDIDHPAFSMVVSEEPEQDGDEVSQKAREELYGYPAPLMAEYKAGAWIQRQVEPLGLDARGEVRVHLQPEEDMDDLFHKDVLQLIPYQDDTEAYVADVPSQRKHSEPEQDLDYLYHQ